MRARLNILLPIVTVILASCNQLSSIDSSPQPSSSPQVVTETIPIATDSELTSEATPWINEFGYVLKQDKQGHLMVNVPKGDFEKGFTLEQAQQLCEDVPDTYSECDPTLLMEQAPAKNVTIPNNYWIDVYEVTNEQYQSCVVSSICSPPHSKWATFRDDYYENPEFADYPVVQITFDQAQVFCSKWREGRLPSEVEWEYAARGNDSRLWPWGNDISDPETLSNVMTVEAAAGGYGKPLAEVGHFSRDVSPFGIYDMAGNVSEWVDHADSSLPPYPSSREAPLGIFRGGFSEYVFFAASTPYRTAWTLNEGTPFLGFRCVHLTEFR